MPFVVDSREGGLPYQQKFDADGRSDNQPVYVGWSDPGTATSAAKWRIYKITYGAGGDAQAIQFANGSTRFDQVWDNRTTVTYA